MTFTLPKNKIAHDYYMMLPEKHLKKYYVIDIETDGLELYDTINFIGIKSMPGNKTIIFDMSNPELNYNCRDKLNSIAEEVRTGIAQTVFYNGKFDSARIAYNLGIDIPICQDVLFLVYLFSTVDELKENIGRWLSLKHSAMRILGMEDWDVGLKTKTSKDIKEVEPYLTMDLEATGNLFFGLFFAILKYPRLYYIYKLLCGVSLAYRDMEVNGLPISIDETTKTLIPLNTAYQDTLESLYRFGPSYNINYNSPAQLIELLYNHIGLPIKNKTPKGSPSTDNATLKSLEGVHPCIEKILNLRKYTKMIGFLEDWSNKAINSGSVNGKTTYTIHANFNLANTVTGRTSCNNPNLQQVPRNKLIKSLFKNEDPDWELVSFDYSQAELRIMGIISGAKEMQRAYNAGEDLHNNMAYMITEKDRSEEITKEERQAAKAINFGFIYGMQAKSFVEYAKLSYGVNVSLLQAETYRNKFFSLFPEIVQYHKSIEHALNRGDIIYNMFGRPYRVNISAYKKFKGEYLRSSINSKIQSSANDIALMAVYEVSKIMPKSEVRMHVTVHDSLIVSIKKNANYLTNIAQIKDIMENPTLLDKMLLTNYKMSIPLKVDVEAGPWGSGIPVEIKFKLPGDWRKDSLKRANQKEDPKILYEKTGTSSGFLSTESIGVTTSTDPDFLSSSITTGTISNTTSTSTTNSITLKKWNGNTFTNLTPKGVK
jgi:DNA polymerase I-like protein with 3'-5' exonuclease and polymerase domains